MGCSMSRLDNEEVVQMCTDRKAFIKQAIEQGTKFAMGHIAYIDSMKRVSAALYAYVEGDDDSPPLFKKLKIEEFKKTKNPSLEPFFGFSSLDYYSYLSGANLDQTIQDDNYRDIFNSKEVEDEEEIKQKDSDSEEKPTSEVTVEESEEKPSEETTTIKSPKEEKDDDSTEKPRFTVYVEPRPTKGMNEIIKELETRFIIACTEGFQQ